LEDLRHRGDGDAVVDADFYVVLLDLEHATKPPSAMSSPAASACGAASSATPASRAAAMRLAKLGFGFIDEFVWSIGFLRGKVALVLPLTSAVPLGMRDTQASDGEMVVLTQGQ
jgi:hypothetical protein